MLNNGFLTYEKWRCPSNIEGTFHEEREVFPPEHLLQSIWQFQRLKRNHLQLTDGRKLEVLHPGFLNTEAGPDFSRALLRIDGKEACEGDVEIEVEPSGWKNHGHDRNSAFGNVALLASWNGASESSIPLPQLDLSQVIDTPISQLTKTFGNSTLVLVPEEWKGKCSAPLSLLHHDQMIDLLQQAAECRLDMKASLILARAQDAGWEQALYESIFRGLGYKQNPWPMQGLAEGPLKKIFATSEKRPSPKHCQAILLGTAGLLPVEAHSTRTPFLKELWSIWWREQESFASTLLPQNLWRFNGLRPANHPQRRIALGACWAADDALVQKLESWFFKDSSIKERVTNLQKILDPSPIDFWSRHWTFNSPTQPTDQALIGIVRTTDLAINAILPWFRARALSSQEPNLVSKVKEIYFAWPTSQDNTLLRKARQRLLPGTLPRKLTSASLQQGLIQIAADFCSHTTSDCQDCRFPELVENIASQ
ncbi:DUF2851 family protein [bacterium]|nr:DUF2851 family protein [bacterium]